MLAHLACRAPLLISLSPIPDTGLSALSGLSSSLPCDDWLLSTRTGRVIQFVQGHKSLTMCIEFLLLAPSSRCRRLAMILLSGTSYGRVPMEFVLARSLTYLGLTLRRVPSLLASNCDAALAAAKKACFHPRPGVCPMSGIMCSQGGHRITGQMAKAFSSA